MSIKKCTVHVIHAPKGGCGKSRYAINLALDLARGQYIGSNIDEYNIPAVIYKKDENKYYKKGEAGISTEEETKLLPEVIIIDADFSGSSVMNTMIPFDNNNHISNKKDFDTNIWVDPSMENLKYYSDSILYYSPETFDTYERFKNNYIKDVYYTINEGLYKNGANTAGKAEVKIGALFCNRNQETKQTFAPKSHTGESTNVKRDLFEMYFIHLLDYLSARYNHIVIDMTAGQDQYTNSLHSILCKSNNMNYFAHVLMTLNIYDINDSIEYAKYLLLDRQNTFINIPSIQLVLNESQPSCKENENALLEMRLLKNKNDNEGKEINLENYKILLDLLKNYLAAINTDLYKVYFRYEPHIHEFVHDILHDDMYQSIIIKGINVRNNIIKNMQKKTEDDNTNLPGIFTGMTGFRYDSVDDMIRSYYENA